MTTSRLAAEGGGSRSILSTREVLESGIILIIEAAVSIDISLEYSEAEVSTASIRRDIARTVRSRAIENSVAIRSTHRIPILGHSIAITDTPKSYAIRILAVVADSPSTLRRSPSAVSEELARH